MAQTQSLESKVKSYWTLREKNSANGLALLDMCIKRYAEHGDWDHLSRFIVGAMKVGQGPAVKTIIRAAFGNSVKFSLDSKHVTGGKFAKINWPGNSFPLAESNTYGIVTEAVGKGQGWDNKEFQKKIRETLPDTKKARTVSDEQKKKVVKHLLSYTDKLAQDGFNVGEIIAALIQERTAQAALKSAPVGKIVNGEPNF